MTLATLATVLVRKRLATKGNHGMYRNVKWYPETERYDGIVIVMVMD
jgi:hypothetical protein